jgi:glycolate oxidase FAD binding subunit
MSLKQTKMNDAATPRTAEELADVLRAASAHGQPVVPWGAGTLQHLGAVPHPESILLHTSALDQIVEYNPADLTITVEAGATLGTIQAALAAHGQWLPWDPPTPDAATIGGLLAAGVSGPLRLGYGTPRDWVLGMRVALGDGRLVKSGGKVVKNVAGYESHKLHIGALGTLGAIVAATLKVAPLPERVATLVFGCDTRAQALTLAERLRDRPLAPISLILSQEPGARSKAAVATLLAARFAGMAAAVERQRVDALAASGAAGAQIVEIGQDEQDALWRQFRHFSAPGPAHSGVNGRAPAGEIVIRLGVPPVELATALDVLELNAPAGRRLVAYPGLGLAYARWPVSETEASRVGRALEALRDELGRLGGYLVVEDAPGALRPRLDLWGAAPPTLALMRALKAQWDPQAILNRGRYIGGL